MLRNQTNPQASGSAPPVGGGAGYARKPVLGAKAVGAFVPRLTKASFEKYGFSTAMLITDWAQIVGADLATVTAPERLKWPKGPGANSHSNDETGQGRPGATLILRVDDGRALDIQYKSRQIGERINAYFGYRAIAEIRILQAPIERRTPKVVLKAAVTAAPPKEVAAIEDPALRSLLEKMAAGLAARRQDKTGS